MNHTVKNALIEYIDNLIVNGLTSFDEEGYREVEHTFDTGWRGVLGTAMTKPIKRIAIVGSRKYTNYRQFRKLLDKLTERVAKTHTPVIVSGGARGVDTLAERYAKERNLDTTVYPADWDKHGKSAGYIRNHDIWKNADIGIAIWDGKSKGTKHSIDTALSYSKKVVVYKYTGKKLERIDIGTQ